MEQAATHDELVKFAAEKLGGYVVFGRIFFQQKEGEHYCIFISHDLTSWDLMGKGLAVAKTQEIEKLDIRLKGGILSLGGEEVGWKFQDISEVSDIPLAFWTAWYELEHRNSVDNPTGRSIERTDVST